MRSGPRRARRRWPITSSRCAGCIRSTRRCAALAAEQSGAPDPAVLDNLTRIRALPPMAKGRAILVDAASARLWMYEDGRPVDSMKVVVGKPTLPTPMLAGYVRHAIVNPYWN